MTGCGNSSNFTSYEMSGFMTDNSSRNNSQFHEIVSDDPTESSSESDLSASDSVSSGIFSEKSYDVIRRNINIGDRTFEFPCAVKELAPEFVVAKDEPHVTGTDLVTYKLKYNEVLAGEIKIRYGEGDDPDNLDTLDDNNLAELTVFLLDIDGTDGLKNSFSAGSVSFDTTETELTAQFGKPDETVELGKSRDIRYLLENEKAVVFRVYESNPVGRITISEVWQET